MSQARSIRFFDAYSAYAGANSVRINPQIAQDQWQDDVSRGNGLGCGDARIAELIAAANWRDSTNLNAVNAFAVADDYAANTRTLGSLALGTAKSGILEATGDHDWFRITLTAGQTYQFLLKGVSLFDPYLYLRNSAGTVIASDDDSAGTNNSLITFKAATSGTYFLDAAAYRNSYTGSYTLLATSQSAPVIKTYALSTSAATINEGGALTSTVTTTGVAAGTTLYWSVSGTGIDSGDFSLGALAGTGVVGVDGKFTFSHAAANDQKTEGDETAQIKLFSDSARSVQLGSTATVLIKDTSTPSTKSYSISESAATLNEGSILTSTVTTIGVAAGTTLYWSVAGTGIDSSDFSAGPLTGSGVVGSDGKFSFSHTIASDQKTEGDETLQIKLFSDANRSVQVGTTASVLLKDTSVAQPTSGFKLNLVYDAAAMAAPTSFRASIERAAAIIQSAFTDNITINLTVNISGTGGYAYAGPSSGQFLSYSSVTSLLKSRASAGDSSFNALPATSSIQGASSVAVWNGELKALGLLNANDTTTNDGSMGFALDINPNLIVGVALHEITHAMGRVPYGPNPGIFDLFRFTAPGVRLFEGSVPASRGSYFSIDNGVTKLADYGVSSDPSDFLNSGVQGSNDAFNEYYTPTTTQDLSSIDLKQMAVLGYHLSGSTVVASTVTGSPMISQSVAGSTLTPNFGSFAATAQADLLTGTALKDTFSFLSSPNFTADGKGSDVITDFNGDQGDIFKISKSAFGFSAVSASVFQQVESAASLTACLASSTQFVYDHSTGNLFYNQNGCASGFGAGGVFAVLQNQPSLAAANFQFV